MSLVSLALGTPGRNVLGGSVSLIQPSSHPVSTQPGPLVPSSVKNQISKKEPLIILVILGKSQNTSNFSFLNCINRNSNRTILR